MNGMRILVIALVALVVGILVGVGFQGAITSTLTLNAEGNVTQQNFDYVSNPTAEREHLAKLKAGLRDSTKLRIRGTSSPSAFSGVLRIYDSVIKQTNIAGGEGTVTGWRWETQVFTGCFNSSEEDRIYAIMRERDRLLDGAILDLMVELAAQNKDESLLRLTLGNLCATKNGLNR